MATQKRLTASKLRENVYRILDQVLDTGTPVEIERRGKQLRIVPADGAVSRMPGRLAQLKARRYLRCDPEVLVHIDWSREWRP
ncbi:MAG: type II toxin-antitoxin system Phd/YefM family antitoxin [Candidatus Methylomirabilis oxyfera]|nr:type II toxin-antitoxin system Phd/YefM family antitoxin [Candidatus Methylomirabilis oxyfera]